MITTDYAMYTDQGNEVANMIVELSKSAGLNWKQTFRIMQLVASQKPEEFAELMDTEVRQVIYSHLGFQEENFYV